MQTHSVVLTPAIEQAFHEADEYWQRALELEFGDAASQARDVIRDRLPRNKQAIITILATKREG